MDTMILIKEGACRVCSFYENQDGQKVMLYLTKLLTKSWFGDFPILMNIKTIFELYACNYNSNRVTVYKLCASELL